MKNLFDWLMIFLVLVPLVSILLSIVIWSLRNGISPMPTVAKVKRKLFTVLPDQIPGTIYEFGSGWGSLLIDLGRHYPNHPVLGYETSTIPYWFTKLRLLLTMTPNVRLLKQDFFYSDISQAGLIVCYLYPGAMRRLKIKFENELESGAWVISHTFALPGWKPVAIYEVDDLHRTKIYLYQR